jgi:hypothetical protein
MVLKSLLLPTTSLNHITHIGRKIGKRKKGKGYEGDRWVLELVAILDDLTGLQKRQTYWWSCTYALPRAAWMMTRNLHYSGRSVNCVIGIISCSTRSLALCCNNNKIFNCMPWKDDNNNRNIGIPSSAGPRQDGDPGGDMCGASFSCHYFKIQII